MFSRKELTYSAIYSFILPIGISFEYQFIAIPALLISFPFGGGAWVVSNIFQSLFGFDYSFQIGAYLGVFIQVLLLLLLFKLLAWRKTPNKKINKDT
jgi:hypothetical protein